MTGGPTQIVKYRFLQKSRLRYQERSCLLSLLIEKLFSNRRRVFVSSQQSGLHENALLLQSGRPGGAIPVHDCQVVHRALQLEVSRHSPIRSVVMNYLLSLPGVFLVRF